jgi:hypothetical protein
MQDASKPIWFKKEVDEINVSNEDVKIDTGNIDFKNVKLLVATPVHSEVSIHYAESLLTLQGMGHSLGLVIDFLLLKSSLVTQGRNLCVSNFLNKKEYTHMLFIDSDISFDPSSVLKLLRCDKDVVSIPYPMKTINWNKVHGRIQEQKDININDLSRSGFMYPIKVEDQQSITVSKGIMEVTHAPTGFMLIKKEAILKMIEKYPHLKIKQPTIINGEQKTLRIYGISLIHGLIKKQINTMEKTLHFVKNLEILVENVIVMLMILSLMLENILMKVSLLMN